MISIKTVTELQRQAVTAWHTGDPEPATAGFEALVLKQHRFNFDLWHEEDIARGPEVPDAEIARVKRSIDRLNQQRNDHIEKLDAAIIDLLDRSGVIPRPGASLNTETPGSAIDRLSIMALRIYHLDEQFDRPDADAPLRQSVRQKLERCFYQHADLSQSLEELFEDLVAGRKILKVYHQFKMYNDPNLNPYLYKSKKTA